jgi:FixJ family two-component response regulator
LGGAGLAKRLDGVPVMFMSGNLDVESLREQVEQGQVKFLQKPVSLRELARATREVLDGLQDAPVESPVESPTKSELKASPVESRVEQLVE